MTFSIVLNVSAALFGLTIIGAWIIQHYGDVVSIKRAADEDLSDTYEMDYGSTEFATFRVNEDEKKEDV